MTVTELADEVRESNRRQAEVNERLADEIHELNRNFNDFRVEIAEKLGAINTNLERFQGRTETSFKVAVWGISVATAALISITSAAIAGAWYASKLDSRVQQLETRLGPVPVVPAPKAP
jgi:hypothetical protein